MAEGQGRDALLVAADLDPTVGKFFREPTPREREAAALAEELLADAEAIRARAFPPCPIERIPGGNSDTVRAVSLWGADLRRPVQRATDPRFRAPGARDLRNLARS